MIMNIAIVLSGGTGKRLGGEIPKQYIKVEGKPIIMYCLEVLVRNNAIDGIQIVAEDSWQDCIADWMKKEKLDWKLKGFSQPGENRQISIFNGLDDIMKYANANTNVFIHDAARPFLSDEIIEASFEALRGYDGVIPVLPMKDTVYLSKDGNAIDSLLNRDEVFAGQAPETFVLEKYYKANKNLCDSKEILKINGSTEPAIMAGMTIRMIPGDEKNFKITTKADLQRFEDMVRTKK
jgi:2-C-methyl-D-erythritol 4-phosphate cytidylyltransferase